MRVEGEEGPVESSSVVFVVWGGGEGERERFSEH